jgi:hypothetical protein
MPKPTQAHKQLEILVGIWSGEERLHPSPWDPQGGTATGRVTNRLDLDGFVVVQEYVQERHGIVTFRGHGIFWWDARMQKYVMTWFDSMGMPPNEFRGDFVDNVLTVSSPASQGYSRAVFDMSSPGSYRFQMDVSPDGNEWHTFMEGRYTRHQETKAVTK